MELLRARWPERAAALREKLALGEDELADWRDAVDRIVTGFDPQTGLYEQFAGYHALEPFDLAAYAERTVPIDVVIGRERTQALAGGQTGRRGGTCWPCCRRSFPVQWPRRISATTSRAAPTAVR